MPTLDLNDAVRSLVADEVDAALAPYRSTLQALATLAGGGAVRRGPGRPPGSRNKGAGRPAKARRGRPPKRAARSAGGGGDASKFSNGQAVRYKQGRGEFAAKVVKIDANNNRVTIERDHDGKKVVRPADKVYAA
jgi:hypothetical protein